LEKKSMAGLIRTLPAVFLFALALPAAVAMPIGQGTAPPVGAGTALPVSAAELVRRGFEALARGDLALAERSFKEGISGDNKIPAAYIGLAEVSLKRGKPEEAQHALERGLKVMPNESSLITTEGRLAASRGKLPEAVELLKRAIALKPDNAAASADLGDIQLSGLKRPNEAAVSFRSAIKADPKLTRARVGLGMALAALGEYKDAVAELRKAAVASPKAPEIPHLIGRIYAAQKDLPKAFDAFSASLAVDPHFLPALRDRADVAAELAKNEVAAADYRRLLQASPGDAQTTLKLAIINDRLKRDADAERLYKEALKLNPDFAVAYNNLASKAAQRRVDLDQALKWSKRAVELSPNVPQFRNTLGEVYRARGQRNQAANAFEAATKLNPPLAEAFFNLGLSRRDAGRFPEARDAFSRALKISNTFEGADVARRYIASHAK
jgi:tetratricopeptide (TPR) repeat protein